MPTPTMEGEDPPLPRRRDINELLATGSFTTTRGKSPAGGTPTSSNAPYLFRPSRSDYYNPREETRNRGRSKPPPPRPTVEDEDKSLSRESSESRKLSSANYDPPSRGIIDQNPIILESDLSQGEAARLQKIPYARDLDEDVNLENRGRREERNENLERRFVLIPKTDTYDPKKENEVEAKRNYKSQKSSGSEPQREERNGPARTERPQGEERKASYRGESSKPEEKRPWERPEADKKRSRQDLPVLETKVPREIPPQFRRSNSAVPGTSKDAGGTPRNTAMSSTPAELFLSPEAMRPPKEPQPQSSPRQNIYEALWGKPSTPFTEQKSTSGSGSQPGTPVADRRNNANPENGYRLPTEKLTRPQQLAGETPTRRQERHPSPALSTKSTRSSTHSGNYYSSSEGDDSDSLSDCHKPRTRRTREEPKRRSPSRSNRSSLDVRIPGHLSPLPSPRVSPSLLSTEDTFGRTSSFPAGIRDRNASSRPVSPYSSDREGRPDRSTSVDVRVRPGPGPTPNPVRPLEHPSLVSMPIPISLTSLRDTGRSPSMPQSEEGRPLGPRPQPTSQAQQKPFWQPPQFRPPPRNTEYPSAVSYRRLSHNLVPLPSCPRENPTRGRNDWLTLPGCAEFDVCPTCFSAIIAPTKFGDMFVPAWKSPEALVVCDFGSVLWYRIAWLLTIKDKRHNLDMIYDLADVAAKIEPCPGKHGAVRSWYSVLDPQTDVPVQGFNACQSCVRSVEVLLPGTKGTFVKANNPSRSPRVCSLRFDSLRFIHYFDELEKVDALATNTSATPYTRDFVALCRRFARSKECLFDTPLVDERWHMITQLPEFTVCEECFDEVVVPEIRRGKPIAKLVSEEKRRMPTATCQLYGNTMRDIFRQAVDTNDYKLLARKARERLIAEEEYQHMRDHLEEELGNWNGGNAALKRELQTIETEWKELWE